MSRFCGFNPKPTTRQVVKKFEDEVMIGKDYRFLIPTVYIDMNEYCWIVAIAYSTSRPPGTHWQENLLEVRYTYSFKDKVLLTMMRTDPFEEVPIVGLTFEDPDAFEVYAITHERKLLNCPEPEEQRNDVIPVIAHTLIDTDFYEKELLDRLDPEPYEPKV